MLNSIAEHNYNVLFGGFNDAGGAIAGGIVTPS